MSRAQKDAKLLNNVGLKNKVEQLLNIIQINPFQNPPPYEKMIGYSNKYSRRINKQHRLVY
jgi:Txe/YoeB family toxin of toxin-antitoxin system